MKKFLLIVLMVSGMSVVAQTPRLALYEEFTGENCPPCAQVNPYLNGLLANPTNTPKVVAIKWQVPIPSPPSATWSLYQTNKAEIDWRYRAPASGGYGYESQNTSATPPPTSGSALGVNSAPSGRMNGQHVWTYGAASDHPGSMNNSVINSAQSHTTAFSITMDREWDATYSSINLTVNIVATDNFTSVGNLIFRTVMVERHINFPTAPGSNGEKEFDDVAVKSFPSLQAGTPMAGTWTNGQTQTFTLNCPIPSHVRDKAEVAFVGFIQDDGNRKVAQAVRADKEKLPYDMKAVQLTVASFECASFFTPELLVENRGNNTITAFTVTPYLDGVAQADYNWTGSLAVGATDNIVLSAITPTTTGGHSFSCVITAVSGTDFNMVNNSVSTSFYLAAGGVPSTVIAQPFASTEFPSDGFYVINHNGGITWSRISTINGISSASGQGVARMNFYSNSVIGDVDELLLPPMSFTAAAVPTLSFDVAYAQYNAENDKLEVLVSDNCGLTWTSVYSKSGSVLATNPPVGNNTIFVPSNASQWRKEAVTLTGFNSIASEVIVKFVTTNAFGNNLYLDNINLSQVADTPPPPPVDETGLVYRNNSDVQVSIYPNPSADETTLLIGSLTSGVVTINVINTLGQLVYSSSSAVQAGENNIPLNVKDFANGLYNVVIATENGSTVKKLTVSK